MMTCFFKKSFNFQAIISVALLYFSMINGSLFAEKRLGDVNAFIDSVVRQYKLSGKIITLPLPDGKEVSLKLTQYSYNDGKLVLSGSVESIAESEFIFKASKEEVWGWIHIFADILEEGTVYRYSLNENNEIVVKNGEVSEIIKIDNGRKAEGKINFRASKYAPEELPDIYYIKPMPDNINLNELQSKSESDKIIWLDIRDIMDGENPIPYSKEDVWQIFQIVASGFSTYDVNVTTSETLFNATAPEKRGIGIFHNREGRSHCAYDAFGTMSDCEMYLEANGFFAGRTALHEYGHLLGLDDQGTGLNGVQWATYFPGYDEYKWVPIMGNYLYSNDWGEETLYQWSDGNYKAGSAFGMPQEDVLDIITDYLVPEEDDIPSNKPLVIKNGNLSMADNYGMINVVLDGFDEDDFTFEVVENAGDVNLLIDRIGNIGGAMLDVHAAIYDASGSLVVEDNPDVLRYAVIETTLPPGDYTLRISGGEEGNFEAGFPRYGSIGYYGISGTISNSKVAFSHNYVNSNFKSIIRADGVISFKGLTKKDNASVSIYNVLGRKIFERRNINGRGSIDLEKLLRNGCYIINVKTGTEIHKERFVID